MEENKVRETVAKLLRIDCGKTPCFDHDGYALADRILQSPDLRVTLVEPRYRAESSNIGTFRFLRVLEGNTLLAEFFGAGQDDNAAHFISLLNSKEPK